MQAYMIKQDVQKTILKNRALVEVEGGHDILVQSYESIAKIFLDFLN